MHTPNQFRIEIAQFVAAEDHPPKVREASFFVVVAFADIEKSRERRMVFYLLEDSVHDQRNALPTPRVRRATFHLGHEGPAKLHKRHAKFCPSD